MQLLGGLCMNSGNLAHGAGSLERCFLSWATGSGDAQVANQTFVKGGIVINGMEVLAA